MKKIIPICLLIFLLFQSCSRINSYKGWENEHIRSGLRDQLKDLNTKVIETINNNDIKGFTDLLSDTLKKVQPTNSEDLFKNWHENFQGRSFKIFNEYYWKNSNPMAPINIHGGDGDNAYTFDINATTKDTYISLLMVSDTNTTYMLTIAYGNYNDTWKINAIYTSQYSFKNKTAQDFYKDAQRLNKDGDILDALLTMNLCDMCFNPCGPFLKYKNAAKVSKFHESLRSNMNSKYTLPYTLNEINTKPVLFNLRYTTAKDGWYLLVCYKTSTNFMDRDNLKKENDEIQNTISGIFPGVDKNNNMIVYRAFNQYPENGKPYPLNYQFVHRKNEN